jgi:hypothetical protein
MHARGPLDPLINLLALRSQKLAGDFDALHRGRPLLVPLIQALRAIRASAQVPFRLAIRDPVNGVDQGVFI